jgi:UDP-glucose 4-epimerase
MKVLVTGAAGGVGNASVLHLDRRGFDIRSSDRTPGDGYEAADLADPVVCGHLVDGVDAVVHAAAIPQPFLDPDEVVFANNVLSCFNIALAASREGVKRFVYISSETVTGYTFGTRKPAYVQVDELHPLGSDDPYGLSKLVGEVILDGLAESGGMTCVSLRPSWVHGPDEYARYWDRQGSYRESKSLWAYTDLLDLCDAIELSLTADVERHERVYVVADDNILGADLEELVRRRWHDDVPVWPLPRKDAGGVSWQLAHDLLGYEPKRSFRDAIGPKPEPSASASSPSTKGV